MQMGQHGLQHQPPHLPYMLLSSLITSCRWGGPGTTQLRLQPQLGWLVWLASWLAAPKQHPLLGNASTPQYHLSGGQQLGQAGAYAKPISRKGVAEAQLLAERHVALGGAAVHEAGVREVALPA